MTQRLIETWLPIAQIGIESLRERTPMTPFPAPNRLHVWWARRPLVACRAAILASLLPADADRDKFLHALGIHGDPVAGRKAIDQAVRTGVRVNDPYGYSQAFGYTPNAEERKWIFEETDRAAGVSPTVLDPTAGGGSIPFESVRLGFRTLANDLNPVAGLILKATVEWPTQLGYPLLDAFTELSSDWRACVQTRLAVLFPPSPIENGIDISYLWARTIRCPYCDGQIPLSPNWRLAPDGTGVLLHPDTMGKHCTFEIVANVKEQSEGTVTGGDAKCPYPGCGRIVDGDEVKRQAQARAMGEQLYAVVFKRKMVTKTKTGKEKFKWVRGYRAPRPEDDNYEFLKRQLDEKLPEWEANGVVPTEAIADPTNYDRGHRMYGMSHWRDLFSPRQLLCHGTTSELLRELADGVSRNPSHRAAIAYLASAFDKMRDYNSRMTRWHSIREVVANTFDSHNFAMRWSFVEMAPLVEGMGFDWALDQTAKCIEELIEMTRADLAVIRAHAGRGLQFDSITDYTPPQIIITCQSGDSLAHVDSESVDCIVMDPPYYDNVMYAELSDFFYVWLN